jgi:hypothetical protein
VRGFERIGDLYRKLQQHLGRKRFAADGMLQRLSLEHLHRDEELPLVLADFVNRADVRMVEGRCRAGFATEALHGRVILSKPFGKELERDVPAEAQVFRLVDDAHASAAQLAEHPIVRDRPLDHLVMPSKDRTPGGLFPAGGLASESRRDCRFGTCSRWRSQWARSSGAS